MADRVGLAGEHNRRPTPPPRGPTEPAASPSTTDHGTIALATLSCRCSWSSPATTARLLGAVPALERRVEPTRAPGAGVDHQRAPVEPAPGGERAPRGAEEPARPPPTCVHPVGEVASIAALRRSGPVHGDLVDQPGEALDVQVHQRHVNDGAQRLRAHGREGRIRSPPPEGQHHPCHILRVMETTLVDEPVPTCRPLVIRHPALRERHARTAFGFGDRAHAGGGHVAPPIGLRQRAEVGLPARHRHRRDALPPAVRAQLDRRHHGQPDREVLVAFAFDIVLLALLLHQQTREVPAHLVR